MNYMLIYLHSQGTDSRRREVKFMTIEFAKKFRQNNSWVKHVLGHPAHYPTRQAISFNAGRGLPFHKHWSYGDAAILTVKGEVLGNGHRCTKCGVDNRNGNGIFQECVAFSKGRNYPDLAAGVTPFNGACSNCYWGGQASRCSLYAGGSMCYRLFVS